MYYYYCPEHSLEYVEGEQKALNPRNCQFFWPISVHHLGSLFAQAYVRGTLGFCLK